MENSKLRCASCDVEIFGIVFKVAGGPYCCSGCARGGPCTCTYDDQGSYPRNSRRDLLLALESLEDEL